LSLVLSPFKLAHNILCLLRAGFRSRDLAHETKRGTKLQTYSLHVTAPLQKHFVGSSSALPFTSLAAVSFVPLQLTLIILVRRAVGHFSFTTLAPYTELSTLIDWL